MTNVCQCPDHFVLCPTGTSCMEDGRIADYFTCKYPTTTVSSIKICSLPTENCASNLCTCPTGKKCTNSPFPNVAYCQNPPACTVNQNCINSACICPVGQNCGPTVTNGYNICQALPICSFNQNCGVGAQCQCAAGQQCNKIGAVSLCQVSQPGTGTITPSSTTAQAAIVQMETTRNPQNSVVGQISGVIRMDPVGNYPGAPVAITGSVTGLPPGMHGLHVHEYGDITSGCTAGGGHFNPEGVNHGGPNDLIRHVGDLGNIQAGPNGVANINLIDRKITLNGINNILGLTLMIHSGQDDYGKGGYPDSLTTGHAGGRLACGVICTSSNCRLATE